jgi:hypothetical protein
MRLAVNILIVVMLLAVVAALGFHYLQQQRHQSNVRFVRDALTELHETVAYHKALSDAKKPRRDYPDRPKPQWFDETLPTNVFTGRDHPWIDVAPDDDSAAHPPDPIVTRQDQAGIWYNPSNGIFRARVPKQATRAESLRLYNKLNGTNLREWPGPGEPTFAGNRDPKPLSLVRTAAATSNTSAPNTPTQQPTADTNPNNADTTDPSDTDASSQPKSIFN